MTEESVPWWIACDRLLEQLSPAARAYVLCYLVSPWSLAELLEGAPDGEVVLSELRSVGAVREVDGLLELCWDL